MADSLIDVSRRRRGVVRQFVRVAGGLLMCGGRLFIRCRSLRSSITTSMGFTQANSSANLARRLLLNCSLPITFPHHMLCAFYLIAGSRV